MNAIEEAIEYLEGLDATMAWRIAADLKLMLPTPRRTRSEDDDHLNDLWSKFREKHPN